MSDRTRWGLLLVGLAVVMTVLDSLAPLGRALPFVVILTVVGACLLVTGARSQRSDRGERDAAKAEPTTRS